MAKLPETLLAPLSEHGERPVAWARTAGKFPFSEPDGSVLEGTIWLVASEVRIWLLAARGERSWGVCEASKGGVELVSGWTRSSVRVGPRIIPLVLGGAADAQRVVDVFLKGSPQGDAIDGLEALEGERVPAARGVKLPSWWAEQVPAPRGSAWIACWQTGSTRALPTLQGSWEKATIWLAMTPQSIVVAASGEGGCWAHPVQTLTVEERPRPNRLLADSLELWGVWGGGAALQEMVVLARARDRWSAVALRDLGAGNVAAALGLVREGRERGETEALDVLGRLAWQAGNPELAASIAAVCDADVEGWTSANDAAAMQSLGVGRDQLLELLGESSLKAAEPVDGWPWPPADAWELQAWRALHQELPCPAGGAMPRAASIRAVFGEFSWVEAAKEWRAANVTLEASRCLDRAGGGADALWTRGRWLLQDGDPDAAAVAWRAALVLDSGGTLLGEVSGKEGALLAPIASAQECSLVELAALDAALREGESRDWDRAATLGEEVDPSVAIAIRELQLEGGPEPRWPVLAELGRLRMEHEGDPSGLQRLVVEEYLHVEAVERAIALADDSCPVRWWAHLARVLAGAGYDPGLALDPTSLTSQQVDALHPGGVGFVASLRQRLHGEELPDRKTLIRGLAKVDGSEFPQLYRAVEQANEALGLPGVDTYLFRGDGAHGCAAWSTEPPVLLIGHDHLRAGPRRLSPSGLRFLVSVELAHLAANHPILVLDADLVGTSRSVYQTFGSYAGVAETVVDLLTLLPGIDQLSKLQTVIGLSRRVFTTRSAVDKVGSFASPVLDWLGLESGAEAKVGLSRESLNGAGMQLRMHADRIALASCGDLAAATDAILRSSSHSAHLADRAHHEGLASVLEQAPDEMLRLSALVSFAATLPQSPLSESD